MSQTSLSAFEAKILATLKGTDNEEVAKERAEEAVNSVESQIAALKGSIFNDRKAVKDATKALAQVKCAPVTSSYCQNIINAQAAVDEAQADLESTQKSIALFEELLKEYSA